MTKNSETAHPIRLALFGGGPGSFIGSAHRAAALMEGRFELVAGVFSRDPVKSQIQAEAWGVDPARVYAGYSDLFAAEADRPDGVQAVAIATPNESHFEIAQAALAAGLHVMCDKPMTATLSEAEKLDRLAREADGRLAVAYTYSGYPMIREAKARIASGLLGAVRKVVVEYTQGWLWAPADGGNMQAAWRTDPVRAGIGGCIGDIGIHCFQLVESVSGLRVRSLCADLPRLVPGRKLDDDCNILMRLEHDVPAVLIASQAGTGASEGLRLRIYGDHASLDWSRDRPDELRILFPDKHVERVCEAAEEVAAVDDAALRLPTGVPAGTFRAFTNIYKDFAAEISSGESLGLPGSEEGLRSLIFIDRAIVSHSRRAWVEMAEPVSALT